MSQPPKTLPADVFPAGLGPASRHMFRASPDGFNTNLLLMLHGLGVSDSTNKCFLGRCASFQIILQYRGQVAMHYLVPAGHPQAICGTRGPHGAAANSHTGTGRTHGSARD